MDGEDSARGAIRKDSGEVEERRDRRDGGSFLLDSRNVSISLIEGLSHGKRVNSIYSRVGGMARWTRTERKERERERDREGRV